MSAKLTIWALVAFVVLALLCSPLLAENGPPQRAIQKGFQIRGEANIATLRMNNVGWRVGYMPANDTEVGMLWTQAGCRTLQPIGGIYSCANDVNDAGVIVGQTDTEKVDRGGRFVRQAFIWQNEQMTNIDHLRSFFDSAATGINRNGWVVGWVANEYGTRHASLWTFENFTHQGPAIIDLGTLGGDNSEATAINRYGVVVGFAETEQFVPGTTHSVAFRYEYPMEVGMTPLPDLVIGGNSAALDVNDFGAIVGWAEDLSGKRYAVAWLDGAVKDLGGFGGSEAIAYGVNNAGYVVGSATRPLPKNIPPGCFSPIERAFVWKDGRLIDLNTLLPTDSGWLLTEARDINERNEVSGIGWRSGELWSFVLPLPRTLVTGEPAGSVTGEVRLAGPDVK